MLFVWDSPQCMAQGHTQLNESGHLHSEQPQESSFWVLGTQAFLLEMNA